MTPVKRPIKNKQTGKGTARIYGTTETGKKKKRKKKSRINVAPRRKNCVLCQDEKVTGQRVPLKEEKSIHVAGKKKAGKR